MVAPSVQVLLFYETMMARTAEQQHVVKATNHPRATMTMLSGRKGSAALLTPRVQFLFVRRVCIRYDAILTERCGAARGEKAVKQIIFIANYTSTEFHSPSNSHVLADRAAALYRVVAARRLRMYAEWQRRLRQVMRPPCLLPQGIAVRYAPL